MPNVLIVHLKRITLDYNTFMLKKINSKFEFPKIINFKKYSIQEHLPADKI